MASKNPNLAAPEGLTRDGLAAHAAMLDFIRRYKIKVTDGSPFREPKAWVKAGEEYSGGSLLVLIHDGPPFNVYCNPSYERSDLEEKLTKHLAESGFYFQGGTCWYGGIYKKDVPRPDYDRNEHVDFPLSDWRYEVANGDTKLGYATWVQSKIAMLGKPETS